MIEVNWSLIKSWSKTESITAIYMSNKSGSWKQSTSTQIYINLVHPLLSYTVFTHVQRNLIQQIKGWNLLIPQDLAFVWQTSQTSQEAMSSSSPSCLEGLKEEIWPEMTLPIILCLELWGYGWPTLSPNFDAHEQRATNTTFLKQSNIVQSSVEVLQYRQAF